MASDRLSHDQVSTWEQVSVYLSWTWPFAQQERATKSFRDANRTAAETNALSLLHTCVVRVIDNEHVPMRAIFRLRNTT